MNAFAMFLLITMGFVLFYFIFNYKLIKSMDEKFSKIYKARLYSDIQDFYREMENYSVMLESRIKRFKDLLLKQDANITRWDSILNNIKRSKKGKQIADFIDEQQIANKEIREFMNELKNSNFSPSPSPSPSPSSVLIKEMHTSSTSPKENYAKRPEELKKPSSGQTKISAIQNTPKNVVENLQKSQIVGAVSSNAGGLDEQTIAEILNEHNWHGNSTKNTQESKTTQQEKPSLVKEMSPKSNIFISLLAKIGETIAPSLTKPTQFNSQNLAVAKENFNDLLKQRSTNSAQLAEHKNFSVTIPHPAEKPEKNERTIPKNETKSKESSLSREEVQIIVRDLHVPEKKMPALSLLINQGFSIELLSDMSDIPLANLQTMRDIYRI